MEVLYNTIELVELEASALGSFVARASFATVYSLQFEEVPQPQPSAVAILNVSGWCSFPDLTAAGLCVMLVGRDESGGILWACSMKAQSGNKEPQHLLESLLVPPMVLGKTRRVAVRVSGGRFNNQ